MWASLEPTATAMEHEVGHDVARLTSEGAAMSRQEAVTLARTAIDLALSPVDAVALGVATEVVDRRATAGRGGGDEEQYRPRRC